MQLIAEGIETEAQLRTVIGLGVDLLQGYYLSRPAAVPAPLSLIHIYEIEWNTVIRSISYRRPVSWASCMT